MNEDSFYLKIAYALSGCQLVEQELKLYITEALDLIKKCIADKMPFKMSGEDYADSSLERLIDVFKKLSVSSCPRPPVVDTTPLFQSTRAYLERLQTTCQTILRNVERRIGQE